MQYIDQPFLDVYASQGNISSVSITLFLGGHHLHYVTLWVCVSVIEKDWVRGYSTKFPRSNGCRGLKFCLHVQVG